MKGRIKYHSLVLDQRLLNEVVDKLDQQLVLSPLYLLMYLNLAQTLQLVQLEKKRISFISNIIVWLSIIRSWTTIISNWISTIARRLCRARSE